MIFFTPLLYLLLLVWESKSKPFYESPDFVQYQPEQIHLSLRVNPEEMVVMWSTFSPTPTSMVEYGKNGVLDNFSKGSYQKFVSPGPLNHTQYIHRVILTGLAPNTTYWYHCGSPLGWSPLFQFNTLKAGSDWSPRLAVFGDLGNVNAQSLPRLQEDVQKRMYDAILHVGDFAYDMDDNNGMTGDEFMRQLEPIAAYVPYMTSVGNHENAYNFTQYNARFYMTDVFGEPNNFYYSFNIGPAHIISFSTEFYYFVQYGLVQLANQYDWIIRDLQEANKPENRAKRPWIITLGHRPMYCSTLDTDDCTHLYDIVRVGVPLLHLYGLEEVFYKYGVDLEIWAHEHNYERLWPIYDRKVYNGSIEQPYTNPKAPVHITTGSAGCKERIDKFKSKVEDWSAFHISDYGYGRITVHNATHLHFEQVSDDQSGKVVDQVWIIKDSHGPYV